MCIALPALVVRRLEGGQALVATSGSPGMDLLLAGREHLESLLSNIGVMGDPVETAGPPLRRISVHLVPDVQEGEYVLLNLGVAVQKLSPEVAQGILDLWREINLSLPEEYADQQVTKKGRLPGPGHRTG